MAWTFVLALMSIPSFTLSYRPVHVPKNLFVQATAAQDEIRVIRRSAGFQQDGTKEATAWHHSAAIVKDRKRRDASDDPVSSEHTFPNAEDFDSLLMYWPKKEEKILVLAKRGSAGKNSLYLSVDYGKNWTKIDNKLTLKSGATANIDHIYTGKKAEAELCILADTVNNTLFISRDISNFARSDITWKPSFIYIHPSNVNYVMGFDKTASKLYWSSDSGRTFQLAAERVKSFSWGESEIDSDETIYVETFRSNTSKLSIVQKIENLGVPTTLLDYVDEFEVVQNFMFATQTQQDDKSIKFLVSYNRRPFVEGKFPLNEKNKDFFVFDVDDDQVFVVINHLQNMSNMYVSDVGGVKYSLSIPRVLYHNPHTDVSSPWLRATIRYAFVDVFKIQSMKGVYVATQLTPGPVGRRHLLTLITYDKGGVWQRVRAPVQDINGQRMHCNLPTCSLHFNLLYGSVYRVSPSESLLSKPSAPGLVLALGVASTNLKIHPDLYVSVDGGVNWKRTLRGKYQFAFGDHGSVIIAVPFRRATRILKYTYDGGDTWISHTFSSTSIQVHEIVTQLDEKLPIFLIYGSSGSRKSRAWSVFFVNMTNVLGRRCTPDDFVTWLPRDNGERLDRCLSGRQTQFQVRNWTVRCLVGKDYDRPQVIKNCECRRVDFECDFGFQRMELDQECKLAPGENLDKNVVPENCPDGGYYNRSQGFRKITGDTCEGGEESYFGPVNTSCPVKELVGVSLSSSKAKNNQVAIATGETVTFTVTVQTGHWPNIRLRWDYGDETAPLNIAGTNGSVMSHKYDRPGHYIAVVTVTNTRSILTRKMHVLVQDLLDQAKLNITSSPLEPSVDDKVVFMAKFRDYSYLTYGHVQFQWTVDSKQFGDDQPTANHRFGESRSYNVIASASNLVSKIQKVVTVKVKPDLTPRNVQARVLGPSTVLILWSKPQGADQFVRNYKVFQSSSGRTGFHLVMTVGSGETQGIVRGLKSATIYFFKVSAFTQNGDGPLSAAVSALTNYSKPGKPEHLQVFNLTETSIKLSWKPPLKGADQITGYTIRWWFSTNADVLIKTETVGSDVLQKVFTNLKQNTMYYFEVLAVSSTDSGVNAGPVSMRTGVTKPALPPRNIQHVTDNGTCAYISWEAPFVSPTDQTLFPAKGFNVYLEKKFVQNVPGKHAQVCGLLPATSYKVQVAAFSGSGEGPRGFVAFDTKVLKATTPKNLRALSISSKEIKILWDPPRVSRKSLTYVITQVLPTQSGEPTTIAASEGVFVVAGLLPFTLYKFTVGVDRGTSSEVSAKTSEDNPDAPEYVSTELITPKSNTIKFLWSQPSRPNGIITSYKILWGSEALDQIQEIIVKVPRKDKSYSYTFKHLRGNTQYSFAVVAQNSVGESPRSSVIKQFTRPSIKGTERLQMIWEGDDLATRSIESPNEAFIRAASNYAHINDIRLAAVEVQPEKKVQFDLLPPLEGMEGPSNEDTKAILNEGFDMGRRRIVRQSLSVLFVYQGSGGNPVDVPSAGAQTGDKSASKNVWVIGVVIPIVIIGIALLAGMVFYYRKFKALEHHYSKTVYQTNNDQLNVMFDGMPTGSSGATNERKKKSFRDSEKIPLGENDELAMV